MSSLGSSGGLATGLLAAALRKPPRRKCFISYHHADEPEVARFLATFDHSHDKFISRGIGATMAGDIVASSNDDYVMSRIRELYLSDSTVTILMIGNCTWSRRYVDWELKASLRSGEKATPNGLLGIVLPSFTSGQYPHRMNANLFDRTAGLLSPTDCYARVVSYPTTTDQLTSALEDAYQARTARTHLIRNARSRYMANISCGHLWH